MDVLIELACRDDKASLDDLIHLTIHLDNLLHDSWPKRAIHSPMYADHQISRCPQRPASPEPAPSRRRTHSPFVPQFVLLVELRHLKQSSVFPALIDSGCAGNFLDRITAKELNIPLIKLNTPIPLHSVDSGPIGTGMI